MLKKVNDETVGSKIKTISFELLSSEKIHNISIHSISSKDLYDIQNNTPLPDGPLDLRLGVGNKKDKCLTCNEPLATCIGHFGEVKLILPVFNIGLIKQTISTLGCICKNCGSVLLPEKKKIFFKSKMREIKNTNMLPLVISKISAECKKNTVCINCYFKNGTIKKGNGFRIIHEVENQTKKRRDNKTSTLKIKDQGLGSEKDFTTAVLSEELNPQIVLNVFKMVKEEDYELLGMSESPERFIIQNVIVPPPCIRPSVAMDDDGTNEDDITIKISEIVHTNKLLKEGIERGNPLNLINEDWEHLQLQCALLINSDLPQVSAAGQPIRGLVQRLKGKSGRFRNNLSGKRVDFSGRTVISPDPNLSIENVGMPERMAKILTYPEKVTKFNIEKLQKLVLNGPENYPGANYVIGEKFKRFLMYGRTNVVLKEGDIVERHIMENDLVLFNRQPSLHRMSIMCHKVKIHKDRTLKFNECVCGPYNADFDGDEMNIHVPQTEKARAEALELMAVSNNIVTPRHGEPIISATQDFITALYLITSKDTFFSRSRFGQLASYFCTSKISIFPAIKKPVELFTGKQLIEVLIKDSLSNYPNATISIIGKNRNHVSFEDPNDGAVIILGNTYLFGRLDKSIIGAENKKDSVLYSIMKIGNSAVVKAMNSITKLASRYLGEVGFSIGLNDVQPSLILKNRKEAIVSEGYKNCNIKIKEYSAKPVPDNETLEMEISYILNQIREQCGSLCIKELSRYNSPNIMQSCGSKGSKINVSQMVACVGQQIISGTRIPNGFQDRCLPHFEKASKTPQSKGFVFNSFFSGLLAPEFFFHAVSGREGLVDTAVKTAETGYMQRRLMKALEDLSVQYDNTVRNSRMEIVQFRYGEDGVDPIMVESDCGVDLEKVFLASKTNFIKRLKLEGFALIENNETFLESKKSNFCVEVDVFIKNPKFEEILSEFLEKKRDELFFYGGQFHNFFLINNFKKIFDETLKKKIMNFLVEPGTTVGAIAGQSLGEPGTQMTLKTFHFAGVASMNITLGVPRLKEIINAVYNVSTPIINAPLIKGDLIDAEKAKGKIEKSYLKDVCSSIKTIIGKDEASLEVKISNDAISKLKLNVNIHSITKALNLSEEVRIVDESTFKVILKKITDQGYFQLQNLKKTILNTMISGVSSISRVIIRNDQGIFSLVIEGFGLSKLLNIDEIDSANTLGNSIIETDAVLGIEAARAKIIYEIEYTISNHGIKIDPRHIMLLADTMTYKGEVCGITRWGISKMSGSTLMLASFEQTSDHLFNAAVLGKSDGVQGVSESIILGIPISVGTGCMDLYWKDKNIVS